MKSISYGVLLSLFFIALASCSSKDEGREIQMYVGPQKFTDHELTWYNIKWTEEDHWERCYSLIFMDYEPGYIYYINAREEVIENPPQDGSGIIYYHTKTISKVKE